MSRRRTFALEKERKKERKKRGVGMRVFENGKE
jgi:hypothetical protein